MSRIATPTQSSSSNTTSGKSMTSGHTTQVPHEKIAKRATKSGASKVAAKGLTSRTGSKRRGKSRPELSRAVPNPTCRRTRANANRSKARVRARRACPTFANLCSVD